MPPLLWILGLGLATALVWGLLSNPGRQSRSEIAEVYRQARTDLIRLRSGLNRVKSRDTSNDHLRRLALASTQFRPQRPRVEEPPSEAETSASEQGEEVAEGGPLAEDWEYAGGVFIANHPSRSRVWLRKKQDPQSVRSRYSARNRSRYQRSRSSRIVRSRSRSRRTTRRRVKEKELISFHAAQDRFEDEELELEFLIRSVGWDEIVYARPGNPGKEYVLERVDSSPYSFSEETRLEPFAEADGLEEEEEEEEDENHFRIRAAGYVDRVEEDYQRLLRGDRPDPPLDLE